MRLIDADKFTEWLDVGHLRMPSEICLSEISVQNMIDLQQTVDPVHAAGGCYCRECIRTFNLNYEGTTYLICEVKRTDVKENDFCSGGKIKSEQN